MFDNNYIKVTQATIYKNFVIPISPPLFSKKSLAFLVSNILTLGIFDVKRKLKNTVYRDLLNQENEIINQINENLEAWNKLRSEIVKLQKEISSKEEGCSFGCNPISKIIEIKDKLKGLKFKDFKITPVNSNSKLNTSIKEIIKITFDFFLNIASLGFYGWLDNWKKEKNICLLEAKLHYLTVQAPLSYKKLVKKLSTEFKIIENLNYVNQNLKTIALTPEGEVKVRFAKLIYQFEELTERLNVLKKDSQKLKESNNELVKVKLDLEDKISNLQNEIIKLNNKHQQMQEERNFYFEQTNNEKNEKNKIEEKLKKANQEVAKIKKELQSVKELLEEFQKNQVNWDDVGKLGPIQTQYQRKPDDKEIKGLFETNLHSEYANHYKNLKTLPQVIQKSIAVTIDELLEQSNSSINTVEKPKIHFNRSSSLSIGEVKTIPLKHAIYQTAFLNLLKGAKVEYDCNGYYFLCFNDEGVKMFSSNPYYAFTYKIDKLTGEKTPSQTIVFSYTDELTPKGSEIYLGLDPLAIKWIYTNRLSDKGKMHLQNLILEPFLENTHQALIKAKSFLTKHKKEGEFIKIAINLLKDMSRAIEMRLESAYILEILKEKLNSESENSFDKEIFTDKASKTSETTKPEKSSASEETYVEWDMAGASQYFDLAEKVKFPNHREKTIEVSFREALFDMFLKSSDCVKFGKLKHPLEKLPEVDGKKGIVPECYKKALKLFSQQYHICHYVWVDDPEHGTHGCVFSNLAAAICNEISFCNGMTAQRLRNAMANALNDSKINEKFAPIIASNYKTKFIYRSKKEDVPMSVEDYQSWLREGNSIKEIRKLKSLGNEAPLQKKINIPTDLLGEVEFDLAATILKIRIKVFVSGREIVLKNGRMVPGDPQFFYGPNTKEEIILYTSRGLSVWGLREKFETTHDNPEIADSLILNENYWHHHSIDLEREIPGV